MLRRLTLREIRSNLGRYIAILAITALGVGFFAGLRVSKTAMVETANEYLNNLNFYDYKLISTLGFTDDDVEALSNVDGVGDVEGAVSTDALFVRDGSSEFVLKVHSINDTINKMDVVAGRLPQAENECIVDAHRFSESDIGTVLKVSDTNSSSTVDMFADNEYVIVGIANSPEYLNYERGSTSLGNGTVYGFVYIDSEGLVSDCYTELYLTLADREYIYSDGYDNLLNEMNPVITDAVNERGDVRYNKIIDDANSDINEKEAILQSSRDEYEEQKSDAQSELQNAYDKLVSSGNEIEANKSELTEKENELNSSKTSLNNGYAQLEAAESQLKNKETDTYGQLNAKQSELESQLDAINAALLQIKGLGLTDKEAELNAEKEQVQAGLNAVAASRAQADTEFEAASNDIEEKRAELDGSSDEISSGYAQIDAGWSSINEAENQLNDGWQEYYKQKSETEDKLSSAEQELNDAQNKIDDAKTEVENIAYPAVYVLDRTANVGYVCFESDTDIVSGVSTVFPLFFFLVAALVCITTMTRMVDEQRTLIGVLKALGYGRAAIMGKYMAYSCSAALIGGAAGFLLGSYVFPHVFWKVYSIMYGFSSVVFIFDLKLFLICIISYLICASGATWLACRTELSNVAAELIRPKSPKSGKRVFLEHVPFIWNRMKFLQKVSVRNVIRYKQRMVMMIIGIGGCTALLVTGFGIRDSIKDVVNYQYDKIMTYDMSVSIKDGDDSFTEKNADCIDSALTVHESTADVQAGGGAKSAYIVASDSDVGGFIDLHSGEAEIQWPGTGDAVINNKLAKTLNIGIGDTITVRDSDMNPMELTVSGIFDNYVNNYIFVSAETCRTLWGYTPELNTALVNINESVDVHTAAADIMNSNGVITVNVNADMRDRVNTMMKSLDYIVVLIIACAAALAFIVLYNLTNINITERIREIATLKVLGFYGNETASYVFRENMALTIVGALAGLGLGKLLHAFVMSKINIDLVSFDVRVLPVSYLLSLIMTIVFAVLVDVVLYFKLEKINMAESLKSIE